MGDPSASPAASVDALLEERARYESWLARLDDAGRNAPEGVRHRIRRDYQERLDRVVAALREHGETIRSELARLRAEQAELEGAQATIREQLAEAELRHAVGEFGDGEWERISGDAARQIEERGGALQQVTAEIARLADVEQLIHGAPAADTAASQPQAPEPPPFVSDRPSGPMDEPDPTQVAIGIPDELPQELEALTSESNAQAGSAGDELAFLRSVTDSSPSPQPAAPPVAQALPPMEPVRAAAPAPNGATANRTLKCNDCGTMNRPTEWYCERCGAELSTL